MPSALVPGKILAACRAGRDPTLPSHSSGVAYVSGGTGAEPPRAGVGVVLRVVRCPVWKVKNRRSALARG